MAAAFMSCAATCMVDQEVSHRLGGQSQKLGVIVRRNRGPFEQLQRHFVHEGRSRECMVRSLSAHAGGSQYPELVVRGLDQLSASERIPLARTLEERFEVHGRKL